MSSLILSVGTRYMLPLLLLFSFYVLLRGHNAPGGGFIGGLVAASAFALYTLASGVERAQRTLRADPRFLFSLGLLLAASSGVVSLVRGQPFLTGTWISVVLPVLGEFGTPLLFDTGIYLVVIGITLTIIFSMAEE